MDLKTTFQVNPRKVYIKTSKKPCLGLFNCYVFLPEVKELEISSSFPGYLLQWEGQATFGICRPLELAKWFAFLPQIVEYF